ncbi:hypothetical protein [Aquimarina pacifica]|uniref:hypothetical protein n=1 Tax=Aquimarina pacifica TaxID=1296415 RepID=UPI0004B10384|nr:hypothetical protein [Aquimarina pacifica]
MKNYNAVQELSKNELENIFGGTMIPITENTDWDSLPDIPLGDPTDWDQFPKGGLVITF